ncbi:orotidine-5'-phosphate decarboxylase [Okibacterium sp. HSC-33S16]|uniref:orotidine-5'-phosphate decarboxylase n=1 Tax=Okibacterium sp. HSC-33S16 TaxID=2910965 RepID=UPI00209C7A3C|nr:orotidine-5'-phosphate decarboxylase [Okibacterium sp. HSC-33S16]MCP2030850.1 orotidine-5'-phosphate decarboxylase [Okibacterium sp. HSC-33S16]
MTLTFGERLERVFAGLGRLCVGIDPHPWLLAEWGLPDSAAGTREFGLRVLDAVEGNAGIVKPQVAFFERFGSVGYAALEEILASARQRGILVIADGKRGDLGTSVEAYGQAWLTPGSPLEADALTVSAYQGVGSLAAPSALAEQTGKGLFVLAATSNPEGSALQQARMPSGTTVARTILDEVNTWNGTHSATGLGSIGVVIGATLNLADFDLEVSPTPVPPVLAPGFGHQGASVPAMRSIYGALSSGVIVSESRSVLGAGPEGIRNAVSTRAENVRQASA